MANAMRVAVCGPVDWVRSVSALAAASRLGDVEIVGAGGDDPWEAQRRLDTVIDDVDAILFDGRIHHDRVVSEHPELSIPALYLPVTRPMIYPTLIRALRAGEMDVERISIDSVDDETIHDLYGSVDIPWQGVHTVQYHGLDTTEHYTEFHQRLYERGVTTGALTSMRVVVSELRRRGVPVLKLNGPGHDGVERLQGAMATLLGQVHSTRTPDAQLVIGEVAVARSTLSGDGSDVSYWQQELGLEVHKILLAEARPMGGSVAANGFLSYTVTVTMSGFRTATRGLRYAPFLHRIHSELGVVANAGFGIGGTTAEATTNARLGLGRADETSGCSAVLIDQDGVVLSLPMGREVAVGPTSTEEFLASLVTTLRSHPEFAGQGTLIVDAAAVARVMGMSERSARRRLDLLVDHGAAWPMKSTPSALGGRPRLHYRILEDRKPAGG